MARRVSFVVSTRGATHPTHLCEKLQLEGVLARKMNAVPYGAAIKALINGDAWVHDSTDTDKTSNYLWRANHVVAVPRTGLGH